MLTEDKTATTGNSDGKEFSERETMRTNIAHEVLDKFFADQDFTTVYDKLKFFDDIIYFVREKYNIDRHEVCDERLPMQDFQEILWFASIYVVHERNVTTNSKWPFLD